MADLVVLARDKMAKNRRESSGKRDSDERLGDASDENFALSST